MWCLVDLGDAESHSTDVVFVVTLVEIRPDRALNTMAEKTHRNVRSTNLLERAHEQMDVTLRGI